MAKTSRVPEHRRQNLRAAIDNTGAVSLDSLLGDDDQLPASQSVEITPEPQPQADLQQPPIAQKKTELSPDADLQIATDVKTDQRKDQFRKSTFYLAESDVEGLRRYSFKYRKDKSAIVREALRQFLANADLRID